MKNKKGCLLNLFLITGFLTLASVVTYRYVFYARYLHFHDREVEFDWHESERSVWVNTDANSWTIEKNVLADWITYYRDRDYLCIFTSQNDSVTDRECYVKIRSGYEWGSNFASWAGFGKSDQLKIVQKGKHATYLNVSKQTVSFSERGGSESLQISTDGNGWHIEDCPNWITNTVSGNTLVLRVPANNGNSSLAGIVRIKSDGIATEIKVLQESAYGLVVNKIWIGYEDIENEGNPYFGKRLYSDYTLYLIPKIEYSCSKSGSYRLLQKLYQDGYSIKQIVQVNLQKGNHSIKLPDPDPESHYDLYYWPPGHYRYEIWYNGQCLATEYFTIY